MKEILFIFNQKDFDGGASRSLATVIKKLNSEKKYKISVLLPNRGKIEEYFIKEKIEVHINKFYWTMLENTKSNKLKKIVIKILNKYLYFKIYLLINKKKINLIYTNTSVIDIGFYLSKKIKCNHIFHIREFGEEDYNLIPIYSIKKYIEKLKQRNTQIIAISNSLKKKYSKYIDESLIEVIYNGIENKFYQKKYLKSKVIKFLMIGSIQRGKSQLEALKAIKILDDKNIKNLKLYFIGDGDEQYKKSLLDYILENDLEDKVEFLGSKNEQEIKESINKMDIGLMLSIKEAFGRVTVEYMLGGLPVIATNTGANPELIKNDINGYLYESGNEFELADKMEVFIKNFNKIKEMGENSKRIAIKKFTAEINYNKIKKIIERQINKNIL